MPMTQKLSALPAKRRWSLKLQLRLVCPTALLESAENLPIVGRDDGVILRERARVPVLAELSTLMSGEIMSQTANEDDTVLPSPLPVSNPRLATTPPRLGTGSPLATVNV